MNILFVSSSPLVVPFAEQVLKEGHSATVLASGSWGSDRIEVEESKLSVKKVTDFLGKGSFDLAVVEGAELVSVKAALRRRLPTLGPSEFTTRLGKDKSFAETFLASLDIPAAPTDPGEGPVSIWRDGYKVCECQDSEEYREVEEFLSEHQVQWEPPGVPLLVGGWFDGHSFGFPLVGQIWWEYMATGGLGLFLDPPAGLSGWIFSHSPQLHKEALLPLVGALRECDFRGALMVKAFVTTTDFCVTDVVSGLRMLLPFLEGTAKGIVGVMHDVATGRVKNWFCHASCYSAAMMSSTIGGAPLLGLNEGNLKHLLLMGVEGGRAIEDPVLYCTAWGKNWTEARRRVYRTLETVKMPGGVYRTDVGRKVGRKLDRLDRWL